MSDSFPEYTVSSDFPQPSKDNLTHLKLGPVFFPEEGVKFKSCTPEPDTAGFQAFRRLQEALAIEQPCLQIVHRFDKLEVFVGEDFYKIDRLHGSALYEGVPQVRTEPLVSLRLSDEQRVFPPAAEGLTPKILLGPSRVELQRQGRFMVHDEKVADLFVQLQAQRFQLGVAWKDSFVPDLLGPIQWSGAVMQSSGWGPIQFDFWTQVRRFFSSFNLIKEGKDL